ncbi:hypothetical protein K504DRAFT_460737 [Pleomassaria siparia CBS 279.74]|uniref:Uncharacterized protein n=1 Tax=Pleomassaria siparia CBS 279.74 TaxID=1314801 RepID=A0A6G1JWT5_9PLEO|nr:hypothetical protein K504DRAFT_460737 [Pleomassaria siparia CBS 279.74]
MGSHCCHTDRHYVATSEYCDNDLRTWHIDHREHSKGESGNFDPHEGSEGLCYEENEV